MNADTPLSQIYQFYLTSTCLKVSFTQHDISRLQHGALKNEDGTVVDS